MKTLKQFIKIIETEVQVGYKPELFTKVENFCKCLNDSENSVYANYKVVENGLLVGFF